MWHSAYHAEILRKQRVVYRFAIRSLLAGYLLLPKVPVAPIFGMRMVADVRAALLATRH